MDAKAAVGLLLVAAAGCTSKQAVDAAYVRAHGVLLVAEQQPGTIADLPMYAAPLDGSTKLALGQGQAPSWTPDGRVIYESARGGTPQIWIADADGANPRQIGNLPGPGQPFFPQQAANGTVLFEAVGNGASGIWAMNDDGSNVREIALTAPDPTQPSLAPSGTWLTFTSQTDAPGQTPPYHREIWRIDVDGSHEQQLTFDDDTLDNPDANASNISPDETTVAFFSGTESDDVPGDNGGDPATWGYRNVAVVPAGGGARTVLTECVPLKLGPEQACVAADNPAWSPDGGWLLFDTDHTGVWTIDRDVETAMASVYADNRGPVRVPLRYR